MFSNHSISLFVHIITLRSGGQDWLLPSVDYPLSGYGHSDWQPRVLSYHPVRKLEIDKLMLERFPSSELYCDI